MVSNKFKYFLITFFCFFAMSCPDIKSSEEITDRTEVIHAKTTKTSFTYPLILGLTVATRVTMAAMDCYCYCNGALLDLNQFPAPLGISTELIDFRGDLQNCQNACSSEGWGNVLTNLTNPLFYQPTCGNPLDYPSTPGNTWNWD